MNEVTKNALQKSIKKWQRIVDGTGVDDGCHNCALCEVFYYAPEGECLECPVFIKTEKRFCHQTPYDEWSNHQEDEHSNEVDYPEAGVPHSIKCPTCERLAEKEVKFLKGLLDG